MMKGSIILKTIILDTLLKSNDQKRIYTFKSEISLVDLRELSKGEVRKQCPTYLTLDISF